MAEEKPSCLIKGCARPKRARGMCTAHYEAHYQRGISLEDLVDPSRRRLVDGVPISGRVSKAANDRLETVMRQKKVRSKYKLISMILERWDGSI
jgi:hypothetical protein